MKTVQNEQVMMVDVDDTLIVWGKIKKGQKAVHVTNPHDGAQNTVRPHAGHIKILKDRKSRGAYIVVWSAGGYAWAEAVVKALGLTEYVDQIMTKPFMYMDDKTADEILGERCYLGVDSTYGT